MMMEGAANVLVAAPGTAADGLLVNLGANNDVTVTGTVTANAGTNLNTSLLALESGGNLASVVTAVQLIDDTVKVLGTDTYTEATSKGLVVGGIRRDADTSAVNTDNEFAPLQVDALGRLKVEVFSGETLPVSGTVTANAGTNLNTSLLAVETGGNLTDIAGAYRELGTDTYTEGASVGAVISAVRRDADTTLVGTTNEFAPLQVDALGRLKVEAFSGETLPVSLTSTTITGTVAVTQSGTWDEVGINDSGNSITVDNGGTFATQVDGAALTALQLIDDPVQVLGTDTYTEATSKGMTIGAVRRDADTTLVGTTNEFGPLQMDANGRLKVEAFSGETLPVSLASTTVTSISAGDNNIGNMDIASIAAGDTNIGNVDIVTMPNVTLAAGTNTNEVVGDAAHDAAAAGNPVLVGGYASAAAPTDVSADADAVRAWMLRNGSQAVTITAAGALIPGDATNGLDVDVIRLPASTNTLEVVGDVAHSVAQTGNPLSLGGISQNNDDTVPPNRVDAEGDATRIATDWDGAVYVRTHSPMVWSYHVDGSTALTDATVHAAPAGGTSLYVGSIVFSSGAATAINMFLEEGASKVLGPYYLEAVAGRGMSVTFNPPKKITAATALTVTTSASIAHSIDITGFTAQG
jgi:hypothetical protein